MFKKARPAIRAMRRALKRPQRGAFQDRHAVVAKTLYKTFQVQRSESSNIPDPGPERTSSCDCSTCQDESMSREFADFDSVNPYTSVDIEDDATLGQTSWRKTPSSKLRKDENPSIPAAPVESIDSVVASRTLRKTSHYHALSTLTPLEWQTNYQLIRNIVPGNQGRIDVYKDLRQGTTRIVKKVVVSEKPPKDAVFMKTYLTNSHPNIVERFGIFYDEGPTTCNLILEHCSGGDLFDFTSEWRDQRREHIPEMFLLHFIASMGEALGFIHLGLRHAHTMEMVETGVIMPTALEVKGQQPILHRDIKLDNIFLRWSDKNKYGMPDIVLGDFGGAQLESESQGAFGTEGYYPPEIVRFQTDKSLRAKGLMTKASDVYTFAACLGYMILWTEFKQPEGMGVSKEAFEKSNLKYWPLLQDLVAKGLEESPKDRPDTKTLFDWAPVLKNHIRLLYENGTRMPEGSYKTTAAQADVQNKSDVSLKAVREPSSSVDYFLEIAQEEEETDEMLNSEEWAGTRQRLLGNIGTPREPLAKTQSSSALPRSPLRRATSSVYVEMQDSEEWKVQRERLLGDIGKPRVPAAKTASSSALPRGPLGCAASSIYGPAAPRSSGAIFSRGFDKLPGRSFSSVRSPIRDRKVSLTGLDERFRRLPGRSLSTVYDEPIKTAALEEEDAAVPSPKVLAPVKSSIARLVSRFSDDSDLLKSPRSPQGGGRVSLL